jgi:hypothetical protein
MSGEHYNIINTDKWTEDEKYDYAKLILKYNIHSIMNDGYVINTDLHSGNILFDKNTSINILDFGMSEILSREEASSISQMLFICADNIENQVEIDTKYDLIPLFTILFVEGEILETIEASKKKQLNTLLADFCLKALSPKYTLDDKMMYMMLREVKELTGKNLRFSRQAYNCVLGLAIVNKILHSLSGNNLNTMSLLFKEVILFFVEE